MSALSFVEIADWIIERRRKSAFENWTRDAIVQFLAENESRLIVEQDAAGINSVIVAEYMHDIKIVYVLAILGAPGIIRKLINLTKEHYPGWEVWGARKNKGYVRYDLLWTKDHKARAPQAASCIIS